MVLMLRSLDIPARLAVGFRGGTWSDRAGAFRVLQKDAHAWVEVPFEGAGWIPFDPTPPESTLDLATTAGRASNQGLAGTAAPASANDAERAQTRPWRNPVLAIAAAGVVVLGAWVLRRRQARSSRGALRGPEAGLHARVVGIATRGGAKRRRSATLRELIGEAPTLPHRTLPELLRVVAWLYRARYGGRPLGAEESLEAGRILIAVERAIDP